MQNKEDLRIRKTKKALFEAFMKLLHEKQFDEITINELCDEAGVRRATFYKHYSDKYDFLAAYTRLLRERFDKVIWKGEKPVLTNEYYVEFAKNLIHFISENFVAVRNICNSSLFPSVLTIMVQQNYKDTCERLRISVENGLVLNASVETVSVMCTGAIAACIYRWVKDDTREDPDDIADQVGAVISSIISSK